MRNSSYPPGCSEPLEQAAICEVCNGDVEADLCICPECPECGVTGDPECYKNHGMVKTSEQIKQHDDMEKRWKEQSETEEEFWAKVERDDNNNRDRIIAELEMNEVYYKELEKMFPVPPMSLHQLAIMNNALGHPKDENYRPYCMKNGCTKMPRMYRVEKGFRCWACHSVIGFDLRRIDSQNDTSSPDAIITPPTT